MKMMTHRCQSRPVGHLQAGRPDECERLHHFLALLTGSRNNVAGFQVSEEFLVLLRLDDVAGYLPLVV